MRFAHCCAAFAVLMSLALLSSPAAALPVQEQIVLSPPTPVATPVGSLSAASGNLVVGGGVRADFSGQGSLLLVTAPQLTTLATASGWRGASSEHVVPTPARVNVFLLGLRGAGAYRERVFTLTSPLNLTTQARVQAPAGWVVTGGGCMMDQRLALTAGNFLTGSYPDHNGWTCESAVDAGRHSRSAVTAFAIALQPIAPATPMPVACIAAVTSTTPTLKPKATAIDCLHGQGVVTGGGARVRRANAPAVGVFLTGTYPTFTISAPAPNAWEAEGVVHTGSNPAEITAYVIAVRF